MDSAIFASIRPAHATCAQARGEEIECRSWQPDSYGTGGILADDYRTIQWFKINALSGGTSYMPTGLGLRPWYLKGFNPVQPIASVAPAPIAAAPEGALPPAAEAPAGRAPLPEEALNTLHSLNTLPSATIKHSRHDRQDPLGSPSPSRPPPRTRCYLSQSARRSLPFPENTLNILLPLSMPCLLPWRECPRDIRSHQAACLQHTTSAHSGSASVRSAACRSMSSARVEP